MGNSSYEDELALVDTIKQKPIYLDVQLTEISQISAKLANVALSPIRLSDRCSLKWA